MKLISNHELFIYKEYIEYQDKYFWKNKLTEEFMNVFLFQMLYTLYVNNTKLELINYDLHLHNIFVKKVKPGGYWVYIIKNIKYYIPNIGYIFIIGDYSNCLSLQFKLTTDELKKYNWFKSIHYDVYSLLQNFTYYNRKKYYIHWNYRNTFVNKINSNNYKNNDFKDSFFKILPNIFFSKNFNIPFVSNNLDLYGSPKVFLTNNDFIKIFFLNKELHFNGFQHGCNYGIFKVNKFENFELNFSNKFFYWFGKENLGYFSQEKSTMRLYSNFFFKMYAKKTILSRSQEKIKKKFNFF